MYRIWALLLSTAAFGSFVALVPVQSLAYETTPESASQDNDPSPEVNAVPLAGCAPASAFVMLRHLGRHCQLADVVRVFQERDPDVDFNRVRAADLRFALSKFGVESETVIVADHDLSRLEPPCILYFRPGTWLEPGTRSTGHFVTFTERRDDSALLMDLSAGAGQTLYAIPLPTLKEIWDGEAIVTPRPTLSARSQALGFTLLGGIAGCCAAWVWCRRSGGMAVPWRASGVHGGVALVACLVFSSGCGSSASSATTSPLAPRIRFDEPFFDAGQVSGSESIVHAFAFEVVGNEPVTIENVETSCGCTNADQSILGRPLAPGSRHELRLTVRPDGDGIVMTRMARVHTKPASDVDVLALSYRRDAGPLPSSHLVDVRVLPSQSATAQFSFIHKRLPEVQPQVITLPKSDSGPFQKRAETMQTEIITSDLRTGQKLAIDTTRIELTLPPRKSLGVQTGELRFTFDGGVVRTLPYRVEVIHPLRPDPSRVFCGILPPGGEWEKSIHLQRGSGAVSRIANIQCDGFPFTAEERGDVIVLRGVAPNTSGRFTGELTLTFQSSDLPPVVVPVSGLVRNGAAEAVK
ncbi:MAG: DUF1573 domain-containing protein [Planctomycetota bacterium]|nr:DUF1573 domain-containing protein [Planctomycetota bacterium]